MAGEIRRLVAALKPGLELIYGARLRGVYLYGSHARGDAEAGSDVDILIVLDRVNSYGAEIERTNQLVPALSLDYGASVSRVFVPERDWAQLDSPFLTCVREEATAA